MANKKNWVTVGYGNLLIFFIFPFAHQLARPEKRTFNGIYCDVHVGKLASANHPLKGFSGYDFTRKLNYYPSSDHFDLKNYLPTSQHAVTTQPPIATTCLGNETFFCFLFYFYIGWYAELLIAHYIWWDMNKHLKTHLGWNFMISIEKSIKSVYTLVTTFLIYISLVLSPIFLSPSGVQHTTYNLVSAVGLDQV